MPVTNVANLDALDPVANIGATYETILKNAVKKTLKHLAESEPRISDLFIGQMAAEGFNVDVGLRALVQSPTVKVEVWRQTAGQHLVRAYTGSGGANWVKVLETPLTVL